MFSMPLETQTRGTFSKTTAEQTLLRTIQELEIDLHSSEDTLRKEELSEQIESLKGELSRVQGPDYSELIKENRALKEKVSALQKELDNLCSASNGKLCETASPKAKDNSLKEKLYSLLLSKYSTNISEFEKKTVGQIKALISDDDLTVQSFLEGIKPEEYSFESNYLETANTAFQYFIKNIEYVDADLDINFWLTPKEILTNKIGDDEDLAVLLCSMLYSLGDKEAEVVIAELDNLTTHAFVITKYKGEFILLDPSQKKAFETYKGQKKDVLNNYSFKGATIKRFLYRFNHGKYEQFL